MWKVTDEQGNVVGLVDTFTMAQAIVSSRKSGCNGGIILNPANATAASKMQYTITEVTQ